jgi:hypothetical protein
VSDFDYVNRTYGVNARIGRVVKIYGRRAVITADRGNYIGVTYDDEKASTIRNAHPMDGVEYLNEYKAPRKPSRSAQRYQEFLRDDSGYSFREWLGIESRKKEAKP